MRQTSRVVGVSIILATAICAGAASAASTEATTGLPIFPGFENPFALPDTAVCGKKMKMAISSAPLFGKAFKTAEAVAWYRAKLPSARYLHSHVQGRDQDMFFTADGSREITITSKQNVDSIYAISFGLFEPALTSAEAASFGTAKQVCGH